MHKGHGILVMFVVILVATFVTDTLILVFGEIPSIALYFAPIANVIVAVWLGLWVDHHYYHRTNPKKS